MRVASQWMTTLLGSTVMLLIVSSLPMAIIAAAAWKLARLNLARPRPVRPCRAYDPEDSIQWFPQ